MLDAETFVYRSAKQITPPARIRMAPTLVRTVVVLASVKLPTKPKLKISNKAPKIIPLIPASESSR